MEIGILSIILGGVAFWILGSLWYSPILFGKMWQKEMGFSDEDLKGANMPLIFGMSLVFMILMSYALAHFISNSSGIEHTFLNGLCYGAFAGAFFGTATVGINYLYQRKSIRIFLIDGVYITLGLALSGGIMMAMN